MNIVVPKGMMGPEKDYLVDSVIRAIAETHGDEGEWSAKYGTEIENETFMMHPFCWCEKDGCPWCNGDAPNFVYKPLGFEVRWYKYIGRSMELNKQISVEDCAKMLIDCIVANSAIDAKTRDME